MRDHTAQIHAQRIQATIRRMAAAQLALLDELERKLRTLEAQITRARAVAAAASRG